MSRTTLKICAYILAFGAVVFLYFHQQLIKDIFSKAGINSETIADQFLPGPLRALTDKSGQNLSADGVLLWTNVARASENLDPLIFDDKLNQAAQLKLQDMFDKQYFEHVSPNGDGPSDLANKVHYDFITVGENLALGNFDGDQDLVQAWMNSPGHRANIMHESFSQIGIAVGKGQFEGKEVWLAVQEFARPLSACPRVNSVLRSQLEENQRTLSQQQAKINQDRAALEASDSHSDPNAYNQKVKEFNREVDSYNALVAQVKEQTVQYNKEVSSFNDCIKE